MLELNNRELATLIWLGTLIGTFAFMPDLRSAMRAPFFDLLKALLAWKLQASVAMYFAYAIAVIYVANKIGLWHPSQFKDTALIIMFAGLPLTFIAFSAGGGKRILGTVSNAAVGMAALISLYVGFVSLPLWGELLLQPMLVMLTFCSILTRRNENYEQLKRALDSLISLIGFGLLINTTVVIATEWKRDEWSDAALSLSVAIWLPFALFPFVYVLAYVQHIEVILVMLPFFNDRRTPSLGVRLAFVWGLHFSTRFASQFAGAWRGRLARSNDFRSALAIMREYRQAVRGHERRLKEHDQGLVANQNVSGVDMGRLQIDRREFDATKNVLNHFFVMHMGWYRRCDNSYRADLHNLLGDLTSKGLPADHGIQAEVHESRQSWRAWRQTPSGWHFGVGGTGDVTEQWQYDGPNAPETFPSSGAPGWVNSSLGPSSPDWAKNDERPRFT
jgi:hypothetical protein